MSKLDIIQNELSHVKADVAALRGENASMNSRLNEIETSCQSFSDIADDFHSNKLNTSKTLSELKFKTNKIGLKVVQKSGKNSFSDYLIYDFFFLIKIK